VTLDLFSDGLQGQHGFLNTVRFALYYKHIFVETANIFAAVSDE
jgi:hypothetical protein